MRNFKRLISLLLAMAITASLLSISVFAAGGYSITVNGVTFKSDENKSGDGWSYDAASETLSLSDYSGSSIVSGGDISIEISGNTTISGITSDTYASACCGISVNGSLNLIVGDEAVVSINGAENVYVRGGDGIVASTITLTTSKSAELIVTGGNSETAVGGFAIKANSITLATKNLVAKGGNNSSALYFASYFKVNSGCIATFVSGKESVSAITYLSNATYEFDSDVNTTFKNGNSTVYFSSVGQFTYGDLNADGSVNAVDAVILAQYLADWNLGLDENAVAAADVFYDGRINAADAVLLAQYLAEWSGVRLGK